jgi:hypothetical protein
MHLPHNVRSVPKPSLERSLAVRLHLSASNISSRAIPTVHNLPVTAPPGQALTQAMQSPHFDSLTGSAVISGASVRIDESRIIEPYSAVVNSALRPIQPSPARVATDFFGNSVLSPSRVAFTLSAVCA